MKIAVSGANGFVGTRLVEWLHLSGLAEVRPIVRNVRGLAPLSRFGFDIRIADALDTAALREAFSGCDVVVCLISGNPDVIRGTAAPLYLAANEAGVRRVVYLSSASVHGQAPEPGTSEESALHTKHTHPYNNAKVQAEQILFDLREKYKTELAILRPGIVFGPRSRWVSSIADDLLDGRAYVINDGKGICNSIYVDNLNDAIMIAATHEKADRQAFLVSDRETVTWMDLYEPIAAALEVPIQSIHHLSMPNFKPTRQQRIQEFRSNKLVQAVLPHIPPTIKKTVKSLAEGQASAFSSPWSLSAKPGPSVTYELATLHQCSYKLPNTKAENIIGYEPKVSFAEGVRRSIGWLEFAGYPINDHS